MVYHVYSTLANAQRYVKYRENVQSNVNIPEREVLINGGSGIARKVIGTPLGVYTKVSDEDMAWLKDLPSFKEHVAKGYIRVENRKVDPEVAAADMATRKWGRDSSGNAVRDDAFPVVPQDIDSKKVGDGLTALSVTTNKAA